MISARGCQIRHKHHPPPRNPAPVDNDRSIADRPMKKALQTRKILAINTCERTSQTTMLGNANDITILQNWSLPLLFFHTLHTAERPYRVNIKNASLQKFCFFAYWLLFTKHSRSPRTTHVISRRSGGMLGRPFVAYIRSKSGSSAFKTSLHIRFTSRSG